MLDSLFFGLIGDADGGVILSTWGVNERRKWMFRCELAGVKYLPLTTPVLVFDWKSTGGSGDSGE